MRTSFTKKLSAMQKTLRCALVVTMLFLSTKILISQTNYSEIIPPAPNSSELCKYVDIPVSCFTGVADISVPLYKIEREDISLPVSLSYYSGGIKVSQIATSVGLGWTLNAGGVIARVAKGIPDEIYNDNSAGFLCYSLTYDGVLSSNEDTRARYAQVALDGGDSEPDMFYYNFLGYSGQFFFDKNKTIHETSQNDLLISYTIENYKISSFLITTPDGNKFIFNQVESTWSNLPYDAEYNSSWYLSRIVTQTESYIFTYEDEEISEQVMNGQTSYIDENGEPHVYPRKVYDPIMYYRCKRLSRIDWENGYIKFNANQIRDDVNPMPNSTEYAKAITNIQVFNKFDTIIVEYDLYYSLFSYLGDSPNHDESYLHKRLKLDSIQKKSNGIVNPPYTFEYDNNPLPPRNSYSQDYWGYNNYITNSTLIPNIWAYPSDGDNSKYLSIYSIYQRNDYQGNEYFLEIGANRNPVATAIQAGILKVIKYPTGGLLHLEYEPNEFFFDNENRIGGGLRIASTNFYKSSNSIPLTKNYLYNRFSNDSISSGLIYYLPQFAHRKMWYTEELNSLTKVTEGTQMDVRPVGGLGESNGSVVGYENVTIVQQGNGKTELTYDIPGTWEVLQDNCETGGECIFERTFPEMTNGVYVCLPNAPIGIPSYYYISHIDDLDNYPFNPSPNYDWNRGQILEEKYYKEEDPAHPVKTITYEYEIKAYDKIPAAKIIYMGYKNYTPTPASVCTQYEMNYKECPSYIQFSFYKIGEYDNLTGWKVLKNKKEYLFDDSDFTKYVLKEQTFGYNGQNHHLLTEEKTISPDGDIHIITYRYPEEFLLDEVVYDMSQRHIINKPIETIETFNGKVISSMITKYSSFYAIGNHDLGFIKPTQLIELETSQPLDDYQYASTSGLYDSRCKTHIFIDDYDENGNILQLHKSDNIYTSYMWDYNKYLPVCKVVNAELDECAYQGFEDYDGTEAVTSNGWVLPSGHGSYIEKTGERAFYGATTISTSNALPTGTYRLSFFIAKAGPTSTYSLSCSGLSASGTITSTDWSLISEEFTVTTPTVLTVTVYGVNIDDLRLFPADAQMTTYTYDPLVGITSQTDANNTTTYYEYDLFGRLQYVKDNDGNILKYYEYNYAEE